jgi:DNA invertase Pin-like site-specific DNA recombinase
MVHPQNKAAPFAVLVAPYNKIPDYSPDLVLPEYITVLYARLSKDDKAKGKEDDSDSIVNQKLMLAKYAQDNRLPNPVFFVDDGISGTTFERHDVQAALGLAEAGRVKNFVVKDLSRFGRDRLKVDFYHEVMFPDLNVRFVAINDNIDSAKGENDMAPIRSMFNEWYARDTSRQGSRS